MLNYHRERFRKLTFRALALRQSEFTPRKRLLSMNKLNVGHKCFLTDHPIGYGNEEKGIENKQGRL